MVPRLSIPAAVLRTARPVGLFVAAALLGSGASAMGNPIGDLEDPVLSTRVAASPDGALLAVVTTSDLISEIDHHVFFSADLGASWSEMISPLPSHDTFDAAVAVLGDHFYLAVVGDPADRRPTLRRFDVVTGALDPDYDRVGDPVLELDLPTEEGILVAFLHIELSVVADGTLQVLAQSHGVSVPVYWRAEPSAPAHPVLREIANLDAMPRIRAGLSLASPSALVPGLVSGVAHGGGIALYSLHRDILDGSISATERHVTDIYSGADDHTSLAGFSEGSADRAALSVQHCFDGDCWIWTWWTEDFFPVGGGAPDWAFASPVAGIPSSWGTVVGGEDGWVDAFLEENAAGTGVDIVLRRFGWDGQLVGPVLRAPAPGADARYELVDLGDGLVGLTGLDDDLFDYTAEAVFRLFDLGFFADGFESGDLSAWSE